MKNKRIRIAVKALINGNVGKFTDNIRQAIGNKVLVGINQMKKNTFKEEFPTDPGSRAFMRLVGYEPNDPYTSNMAGGSKDDSESSGNSGIDQEVEDPSSNTSRLKKVSLNGIGITS
jgi:hypothetical protein